MTSPQRRGPALVIVLVVLGIIAGIATSSGDFTARERAVSLVTFVVAMAVIIGVGIATRRKQRR